MHQTDLLPCPFCGDVPTLTQWEHRDDRRYVAMDVKCCVSMTASIGYSEYRKMTVEGIEQNLEWLLSQLWNTRTTNEEQDDNA